jgi:hypothetical protein
MRFIMDDSDVQEKLAKNQSAIDRQMEYWRIARLEILREMAEVNRGISLMIQSIRLTVQATGQTLNPTQQALLGMVSSTSSLIISTATALTVGSLGLLSGAALALAAFAYSFNLIQSAAIIADFEGYKLDFAALTDRLTQLEHTHGTRGGIRF